MVPSRFAVVLFPGKQLSARLFYNSSNPCDHHIRHMTIDMLEADRLLKTGDREIMEFTASKLN